MENIKSIFNDRNICFQRSLTNFRSRSEMITFGIPQINNVNRFKNVIAQCFANYDVIPNICVTVLLNLWVTVMAQLIFLLKLIKPIWNRWWIYEIVELGKKVTAMIRKIDVLVFDWFDILNNNGWIRKIW